MRSARRGIGRAAGFQEAAVLAAAVLLVSSASAIVIADQATLPRESQTCRDFQSLVRGIGLGPAADASSCAYAFDPRLAGQCPFEVGPIPLGGGICPYHSLSVLPYRSTRTGDTTTRSR